MSFLLNWTPQVVTRQCDTVQTPIAREHLLVHVLMESVRSLGIKCFGFSV